MGLRGGSNSIIGFLVGCAIAAPAHAGKPLSVVSHDATYDPARDLVQFEIEFDRVPDFFTLDDMNRQRDAFQIWIDSAPGDGQHGPWERIVRGGEIWIDGEIPVRDDTIPTDPVDPYAGGWGPIVDRLPYVLDGDIMRFETSFSIIGTESGWFSYDLGTAFFGAGHTYIAGAESRPVPGPGGALVLLLGAVFTRGSRRQIRSGAARRSSSAPGRCGSSTAQLPKR